MARPLARHKQSTGLFESGLGLPHRLHSTRRAEGADGARRDAQGGDFKQTLCADIDGFNLRAPVRCGANDRRALEQLCRYITRPALANEHAQTNAAGQVVLKLKTPGATAPGTW